MDQASDSEKMENGASRRLSRKKSSVSASRSFKLRSESLNSLRLRRVFDLFDKNKDGLITVDEIKQALVLLGLDDEEDDHNDDIELHSIVTSFIKPGFHGLAFDDFESLHKSLHTTFFFDCGDNDQFQDDHDDVNHHQQDQVESDLTEAFKVFDSNGDGYISATELQQVLSKLGFPEAQQELHHIQHMISSFDDNHDGRVDFFEFKHMMSRTLLLPSA
uniref:EF-hand domain-containing protein n=2 Tax=Chenopodium quinoa TaxID=63459 RepID=A0A803L3M2_CHEQI